MKREGGVSIVPCKVNGLNLEFIFDSGASDVTISLTEAKFMLKNGYLSVNDIIGTEKYQTATGDISEGLKINLREIEFGGLKLRNIEASIINSLNAPLLLGQSVLSKLGSITVNFETNLLTIHNSNSKNKTSSSIQTLNEYNISSISNQKILNDYKKNKNFYKSLGTTQLENLIVELLQNNIHLRENETDCIFSIRNNYLIRNVRHQNQNNTFLNIADGIDIKALAVWRIEKASNSYQLLQISTYGNKRKNNYIFNFKDGNYYSRPNGNFTYLDCDGCSENDAFIGLIIELSNWDTILSTVLSQSMVELSKRYGNKRQTSVFLR